MKSLFSFLSGSVALVSAPLLLVACVVARLLRKKGLPRLMWGPTAIISNKYWSEAMKKAGYQSQTCMYRYYAGINKSTDFDWYLSSLFRWLPGPFGRAATKILGGTAGFLRAIFKFDILHFTFTGGFLAHTGLWFWEAPLLKLAGVKTVVMPYGGDFFMYSRIVDPSVRHALNINYSENARCEKELEQRNFYWCRHADTVIGFFLWVDGLPRNDVGIYSPIIIDTEKWRPQTRFSPADGKNGCVKVIHTPNHRGCKGTEFLLKAVQELCEEGLQVELILVENMQNDEVQRLMFEEADILAEQFIIPCYALSAMEGMSSALPVLANLDGESQTRVFRRYSYLNECPIFSATPESLKDHLRVLVTQPELRKKLGMAGRAYVEKYHSARLAQYLFGKVYERIWHGRQIDLMNLFHPLMGEYATDAPRVEHPLVENRLPC